MYELKSVDKKVPGVHALKAVNFHVKRGEIVGLVGENGAGKSTLMKVIYGAYQPDGGQILWNGEALNSRQRRWLGGLVFQFPERHFLGLTVGQELRLGQRRIGTEAIERVLQQVGLEGVAPQQAPERLSGGQQRRLALAVQLLRDPKVLLLDEPTAGLDWTVRDEVLQLLGNLARERALLVVTHEPDLFRGILQGGWMLEKGRLQPLPAGTSRALPTMQPTERA